MLLTNAFLIHLKHLYFFLCIFPVPYMFLIFIFAFAFTSKQDKITKIDQIYIFFLICFHFIMLQCFSSDSLIFVRL